MIVSLSDTAALHVQNYLAKRGKGIGLRIGVKTTGCSGLIYIFEAVDVASDTDNIFQSNVVNIYVDPKSLPFISGSVVHYETQGFNSGFKIENPNAKNECGCGESFTI